MTVATTLPYLPRMTNTHFRLSPVQVVALDSSLEWAAEVVAEVNHANGWYEADRSFGEDIALLHSEVSEALEAYRDHEMDDPTIAACPAGHGPRDVTHTEHRCKPQGVASELADVLIRLLDTSVRYGVNLGAEFERKMLFNATRGYKHGGKVL